MNNLLHTFAIMALTLTVAACKKDASVSLAECIVSSYKELLDSNQRTMTKQCNIGLVGNYVAVLHPSTVLSDEEYKGHGLDNGAVEVLRFLRSPGHLYESIYIIPLGGQDLPSRTTAQGKIVVMQNLITARKTDPILTVTLEWSPEGVKVVDLQ